MNGKTSAARRFLAGLMLTLGAILLSVLMPALDEGLFESALIANVDAGLAEDAEQLRGFARQTIGYIGGRQGEWSPTVVATDGIITVSEAFSAHMAEVRTGVTLARIACGACLFIGLLLLAWERVQSLRSGASRRIASRAYYLGAATPVLLTLGLCLWATLDFGGFWDWLHRAFIPGGIFSAGEPVMRLFPLSLFGAYLLPVAGMLALWLLMVALLPLIVERIGKKDRRTV